MITDFRLQVFVTTARELSFTRAAEELNVSQPAVTKHIKELERLLTTPLFRRCGNRIHLSSEGERLLPLAKAILESYDTLNSAFMEVGDSMAGRLRIGASTTIIQYILPEILARFKREYPRVELILMSGNSEEVLRGIEQERVDIALVEDAHTSASFHYEHFADDKVVLVSTQKRERAITLKELLSIPLVLRENGSGTLDVVERVLARHHISRRSLNIVLQIGSSEGIVRYLKNSSAYAFISKAAAADYILRKELHICDIEDVSFERSLRFASLHGHSNRLSDIFKEFCLSF